MSDVKAYYRLPYADHYTKLEAQGEPLILNSIDEIGGRTGFVIAPFIQSEECPIVILPSDKLIVKSEEFATASISHPTANSSLFTLHSSHTDYAAAFTRFHDAVTDGRFRKLVLARQKSVRLDAGADVEQMFLSACQMYPRLMIMLFSTPQTGTWLISTPEILIQAKHSPSGGWGATMALAGTMPYSEGYADWSEKNKGEQHVVEQYIEDTITPLCHDIIKDGPYTMRAGNLQHLRTDFRFRLTDSSALGNLIARLHPTPAVCGLPKSEAKQFVIANEGMERRYYSGFAGPVGINGETHLYVSLRCAELFSDHAVLYAGGGIMPDSQCEAEWQETESKMQTIAHVLK